MKKFLPLLFALIALPLLQSCVGPGNYGSGYSSANNYSSSVGIIATSHSRWGYNPYYRSYYDYSLGQYYNLNSGRYYSSLPRRYSSPYYPSNYRRGSTLSVHSRLPHLSSSYRRSGGGFVSTGNSRWSYDPYRRSYYDQRSKRYYNTSSGSYYNSLPKRHSSPSYPSGYRSGRSVQLHSRLPYVSNRTSSSRSQNYGSSRNYGSNNSSSRSSRPTYQNNRNQQPTSRSSSYRSRSSSSRPSSSRSSSSRSSQPSQSRGSSRSSGRKFY